MRNDNFSILLDDPYANGNTSILRYGPKNTGDLRGTHDPFFFGKLLPPFPQVPQSKFDTCLTYHINIYLFLFFSLLFHLISPPHHSQTLFPIEKKRLTSSSFQSAPSSLFRRPPRPISLAARILVDPPQIRPLHPPPFIPQLETPTLPSPLY